MMARASAMHVDSSEPAVPQEIHMDHTDGEAVNVDLDFQDDLLLGGFPEALSVQHSSKSSMESVVKQLAFVEEADDEFVDVYDVDQLNDGVDLSQHPSAQALAQQLEIAQMQSALMQEQNLRYQRELELRERDLQQ